MVRNMGAVDRMLRLTVAVVLGALVYTGIVDGILGWVFTGIASILTITLFLGFCPLYKILGISTFK